MAITKALTFRASSIGDCLMGKYLLENIHEQYPEAKLGIVVSSHGAMLRDLFAFSPWLTIIETNRRDPRGLLRLWRDFRGSDFVVTQYTGKPGASFGLPSKLVARLLAKRGGLIGFMDTFFGNSFLYDALVPFQMNRAVVEHEREALRAIHLPVTVPYPHITLAPSTRILATYGLTKDAYLITHFFAGNKGRSISPKKARAVLTELRARLPKELTLVVTGGPDNREEAVTLAKDIPGTVVLAGLPSLQDMLHLIALSSGAVSVDTGIAHLTAHLGKKLLVLRTCVAPNWWLPGAYDPATQIVQCTREELCTPHKNRDYPVCIDALDASDVAKCAEEFFV